jgi:hypothetical protein
VTGTESAASQGAKAMIRALHRQKGEIAAFARLAVADAAGGVAQNHRNLAIIRVSHLVL